jgi:hypothetical protein
MSTARAFAVAAFSGAILLVGLPAATAVSLV